MVRPPRMAGHEKLLLDEGLILLDFGVRADLSDHLDAGQVLDEVLQANPGESPSRIDAMARQLDLLLNHVMAGDLILCLTRSGQLVIGQAMPGYCEGPEGMPARRLRILRADIPKAALNPDLRHSLGALQKICELARNEIPQRIESLLSTGRDPGPFGAHGLPEDSEEIARILRARMIARIGSVFSGHRLADLVGALLEAEGLTCRKSPPGPDGGVDLIAGSGALGFSGPRVVVQVKSGDIVSDEATLQALMGAMRLTGCENAILVSWSGVTRPVQARLRDLWMTCRLWDAAEIIDRILRHYDRLPAAIRQEIPIRMVPVLE